MSYGVCFCRATKRWEQDQWSWLFSNFGVEDIWEIGKGMAEAQRGKDGSIYQPTTAIENATQLPCLRALVVMAPPAGQHINGTVSLVDFEHPENAIYMFGDSQMNLNDEEHLCGRIPDHKVFIPTVKYEMYAHAAGYITLYDRLAKNG